MRQQMRGLATATIYAEAMQNDVANTKIHGCLLYRAIATRLLSPNTSNHQNSAALYMLINHILHTRIHNTLIKSDNPLKFG